MTHSVLFILTSIIAIITGCSSPHASYIRPAVNHNESVTATQLTDQKNHQHYKSKVKILSDTSLEALERAKKKGKLKEGVFLCEMTMSDDSVFFAFENDGVSDEIKAGLDIFVKNFIGENDYYIEIQVYTDNLGGWERCVKRGTKICQAAIQYLKEKHHIRKDRMAGISYGYLKPVVRNDSPVNRSKNRRITLVVMR